MAPSPKQLVVAVSITLVACSAAVSTALLSTWAYLSAPVIPGEVGTRAVAVYQQFQGYAPQRTPPAVLPVLADAGLSFVEAAVQTQELEGVLQVDGFAAWLRGEIVTDHYFEFGDWRLAAGYFPVSKIESGEPPVVVSWQLARRIGGVQSALNRRIRINKRQFVVTGVASRGFGGVHGPLVPSSFWIPASAVPEPYRGGVTLVRLVPGTDVDLAGSLLVDVAARALPAGVQTRARVPQRFVFFPAASIGILSAPGQSVVAGRASLLLWGAALAATLVSFVNVAGLWLTLSIHDRRSNAIRFALGASSLQLAAGLMRPGSMILIGAIPLGACATLVGLRTVVSSVPLPLVVDLPISLDGAWLGCALGLLTFGAAGALAASKTRALNLRSQVLGESTSDGPSQARHTRWVVVSQGALTTLVIFSSVSTIQAFDLSVLTPRHGSTSVGLIDLARMSQVDFDQANRPTAPPPVGAHPRDLLESMTHRILRNRRDVALTSGLPALAGSREVRPVATTDGRTAAVVSVEVSENFFEVLGIPIVAGRTVQPHDRHLTERVAIVDERLCAQLWPRRLCTGQLFRLGVDEETAGGLSYTVIGVAATIHSEGDGVPPVVYLVLDQMDQPGPRTVLVKDRSALAQLMVEVESAIDSAGGHFSIVRATTVGAALEEQQFVPRVGRRLTLLACVVVVALAAVGIAWTTWTWAEARRQAFAVRLMLGATPSAIARHVVAETLRVVAWSAALGTALCVPAAPLFGDIEFLPGWLAAVTVLTLTAAVAAVPGMRHAMRTSPISLLRP